MLGRDEQREVVREAARAPSAHNVQPARWRFDGDHVTLLEDVSRRLIAADPTLHDANASLGAAFEGMRIALSRRGRSLGEPEMMGDDLPPIRGLRPVLSARVARGGSLDPLALWVDKRRAWRGVFTPIDESQRTAFASLQGARDDITVASDAHDIAEAARLNDVCSWEFLSQPRYQAELYEWMRLTPEDPNWDRDGLNADCLAMTVPERVAARAMFAPAAFAVLKALGVARLMLAEAPRARSAAAIIVFHRPATESAFAVGRAFYRLWLEITSLDLVVCPMSSISDSRSGSATVRSRWNVPAGRRVVNVLRVGHPLDTPALSARLPVDELLIES